MARSEAVLGWPFQGQSKGLKCMTKENEDFKSFDAGHVDIIKILLARSVELSSSELDIIYLALFAIKAFCCFFNKSVATGQKIKSTSDYKWSDQKGYHCNDISTLLYFEVWLWIGLPLHTE